MSQPQDTSVRPFIRQQEGSITRITIPMRSLYAPIPSWVSQLDVLAFVVAPVSWVVILLVRFLLRLPKPPRGVFEIGGERFKMTLCDRFGTTIHFDWPRDAILEARANQYGAGLWMNVSGHGKDTYLTDIHEDTIKQLEAEFSAAMGAPGSATVRHAR